jgi:hypothetical protein
VRTLGREVDDGKEVVHVSLVMAQMNLSPPADR